MSIIKINDNQIMRIMKHFIAFITTLNGNKIVWEVAKNPKDTGRLKWIYSANSLKNYERFYRLKVFIIGRKIQKIEGD